MKYWVLACRLEKIQKKEDPNAHNLRYSIISYSGLVFNFICGAAYGAPSTDKGVAITSEFLQLCILVSCAFLADAFLRLKKVKKQD